MLIFRLTTLPVSAKIPFAVGGIAQLGERLNGIQEVSGSIPLISTKTKKESPWVTLFYYTRELEYV